MGNNETNPLREIEKYLIRRITELREADAKFCADRWDMDKPEMYRKMMREQSNSVTLARHELEAVLKAIPASQPSLTPDQCKDAAAKDIGYKDWSEAWMTVNGEVKHVPVSQLGLMIDKAIEYARQCQGKEWISVKSDMPVEKPLESYKVLAYGDWDDECIAFYQDKHFYATDASDESGDPVDITNLVTHWMSLPSPPTSQEGGEDE